MTFSALRYKLAIAITLLISMASLVSCNNEKVITDATEYIANRDYRSAMTSILSLDDEDIIKSDTLSQLLSTTYYGLKLKPVREIALDCYDMDFVPDHNIVIFTDFHNGSLNFYEFPKMKFIRSILLPDKAYNIDISPDGSTIAAAMVDHTILLYDLASGRKLNTLEGHTNRVRDVVFRDNNLLFSCSNDQKIAAWDVATGEPYWGKRQNTKNIKSLQLSKDKTKLITASNDGSACIVNATDNNMGAEELRAIHGKNYVNDAAISPDNKCLVTVSGDGYVKIWDAENGCSIRSIFLNDPLGAVDISPDGRNILIGGKHNAYIISLNDGKVISKIHGANMPIWSVKFLNNTEFVFADNSRLWHGELLSTNELIKEARKLSTL